MGRQLLLAQYIREELDLSGLHDVNVIEVAGWQTRGSATFNPGGSVDHHTAGPASGAAPSLTICIYGRDDLPGPLCNDFIDRGSNNVYVVAAGRANHAGSGGWRGLSGNSSVLGTERENPGTDPHSWTIRDWLVAAAVHRAHIRLTAHRDPGMVCEHKEWTRRKVDSVGVDGDDMRELVATRPPLSPQPPPTTSQPPTSKEDDMYVFYAVVNGGFQLCKSNGLMLTERPLTNPNQIQAGIDVIDMTDAEMAQLRADHKFNKRVSA